MKENNGIIAGLLFACFPGAMRVFSLFPRHYFFIIAIVAVVVSVLLFVLRKKYRSGWVYCLPVIVISLLIGVFMYPEVDDDAKTDITFTISHGFSKELLDKAEAGDQDAQEEIIAIWLNEYNKIDSMTGDDKIKYMVLIGQNLEMIRRYAAFASENNSALGYCVSGTMKSSGLGGDRLVNQAILDFVKAIELEPDCAEWYMHLLSVDSLSTTHPELFVEYSGRLDELKKRINERLNECASDLGHLLCRKNLPTEELLAFLDNNRDDVHMVVSQREDLLTALLLVFIDRGCLERIRDYQRPTISMTDFSVLPHIPEWEFSRLSADIDSLITMSADVMLSTIKKHSEFMGLHVYATAVLDTELAYRSWLNGEMTSEEYDAEIGRIERTVKAEQKRMVPVIGQDHTLLDLDDKVYVLRFDVENSLEYSPDKKTMKGKYGFLSSFRVGTYVSKKD